MGESIRSLVKNIRLAGAIFGAMGVICFYMIAVLDTFYAMVGGFVAVICLWLCSIADDAQDKKVNFRVITVLAGAHVALIPAIVLSWIKRTETFDTTNIGLIDIIYSVGPISFIMIIGALIGLEVKDSADAYSQRNEKQPRFYERLNAKDKTEKNIRRQPR